MASFEEIYKINCTRLKEEPDHLSIYKGLDIVWNWIDTHEKKEDLLKALDNENLYIVISAKLSKAPDFYYDILSDDNPMYLLDPNTDIFRIMIINKLSIIDCSPAILSYYDGKRGYVKWKLGILERRYKRGSWEKYAESYNSPSKKGICKSNQKLK